MTSHYVEGPLTRKHRKPGWPPSKPGDPGWAGDTPWAGGQPPRWQPPDGLTVLDAGFPIRHTQPPAVFWHLVKHPPVKAPWRAHLGFTVDAATRATAAEQVPVETFVVPMPDDTAPLPVIRVPRVYEELREDTLAHDFTELDQTRLIAALDGGA